MVPDVERRALDFLSMDNLDNFSTVKVLVVGDVMLDKYLWGEVTRISPEAPVPVVSLKNKSFVVGGAANVAANIVGLGAEAYLIGVIGNDSEGQIFTKTLEESGVSAKYIVRSENRPTTAKTRIIAHNQQIARLDEETNEEINKSEEAAILEVYEKLQAAADIIIISDYKKGVLKKSLLARLITSAKNNDKIVLVDPKGKDYSIYKNASILTPNKFEIAESSGCGIDNTEEIVEASRKLICELKLSAVIVTRGEEGITLTEKEKESVTLTSVGRKVYDVTGAGDTFMATLAVALGAGKSIFQASQIANSAAGIVVEVVGTTTIKISRLREAFQSIDYNA